MDKLVEFLPIILPIIIFNFILIFVSLLNLKKTKKVKILNIPIWIIIILFLQIIGPITYLLFGRVEA